MGIALWMVLVPLLAALASLIVPARQACVQRGLALVGSAITLLLALLAWFRFPSAVQALGAGGASPTVQGVPLVSHLSWFTLPGLWQQQDVTVGLSFGLDGLSLTLAGLTALLTLLAAAAVRPGEARMRGFALWSQLAAAGAIAAFTALDLLTFFAGLELSLFAGFFLIYLFGDPQRQAAAVKYLQYRGLASVLLLLALFGLAYGVAGGYSHLQPDANGNLPGAPAFTLAWPALQHNLHGLSAAVFPEHARAVLFWVLLLGILVEEAFVPFHSWLPTAHEHTSAPVSMLLGGVLTKTGAYALLRFGAGLLPDQLQHYATWVAVLGTLNILYGAFAAWAQRDWRRLIAFGSISHMGLVLLATAAGNAAV
ncbi:MAG: hypothetical protein K6T31_05810, partial [Alicyclobacillus sp.]|nr:hypothetical protein [Alicyclobacillus sp.]